MKLRGYQTYTSPSIRVVKHGRETGHTPQYEIKSQAAIFVDRNVPQTQLDTVGLCDQTREIVAVRTLVAGHAVTFVSVYLRPEARGGHNADWIAKIAAMAANEALVIGGDFNAKHTLWGYKLDSRRGNAVVDAVAHINLELLNDTDVPTRVAEHNKQMDTSPDLTWAITSLESELVCMPRHTGKRPPAH